MKKYIITLFVSLMAVFSYGQSVYMHEAQEEAADSSNDGNLLYGLLGLGVLFLLVKIIGLIFKCLAENKKKREDIFKRLEQEKLNQKIKESYRIEKLNKEKFIVGLTCQNTINIDGFDAVDLGLGDEYDNPLWGTQNIGAENITDIGKKYIWGYIESVDTLDEETMFNHIVFHKFKSQTIEELNDEIVTDEGDFMGMFEHDAASKERGGNWMTPSIQYIEMLINGCKWEYIDKYGIKGWKVIGPNGNYIFIPYPEKKYELESYLSSTPDQNDNKVTKNENGTFRCAMCLQKERNKNPEVVSMWRGIKGYIRPISYEPMEYTNCITEYEW